MKNNINTRIERLLKSQEEFKELQERTRRKLKKAQKTDDSKFYD